MKLSPKEAKEYIACSQSVSYFIRNFVYIKTNFGRMKWKPYPGAKTDPCWQIRLLELLQNGEDVVILKSRQVGVSWTVAIFVVWMLHFRPGAEVLLISQNERKAIKLLGKVKFIARNLPPFLQREKGSDTLTRFSVVHQRINGDIALESMVESLTTTGGSGRGDTARFIFVDEFAWVPRAEEVWQALKPATAHGGQVCAASSPNGKVGPFPRLWVEAEAGDNDFIPMKIHYTDCGFDEEWLRKASEGMTITQINQEFELLFIGSGSPAFNPVDVEACYFPELTDEMKILVANTRKFATGVDSAEITVKDRTRQRDYNALVALTPHGIQVAAVNNQEKLDQWAGKTVEAGDSRVEIQGSVTKLHKMFPGYMQIEKNGSGLTLLNRHIIPPDDVSQVFAMRMTPKSKPRLVNQLNLALAGRLVVITDKKTYYQLLMYEDLGNGKYSAPKGWHDDLVVAFMHAYDALVQMGGYDFELPAQGAPGMALLVPGDDPFLPDAVTLPQVEEFNPLDMRDQIAELFMDLDPRNYDVFRETYYAGRST